MSAPWSPVYPVINLRMINQQVHASFLNRAQEFYDELRSCRLEVQLMPAPEPMHTNHKIRVAVNHNPGWYAGLYGSRLHAGGPKLDRRGVVDALERIMEERDAPFTGEGRGKHGLYDTLMRDIVREALVGENGFACLGYGTCPVTTEFFTGAPF